MFSCIFCTQQRTFVHLPSRLSSILEWHYAPIVSLYCVYTKYCDPKICGKNISLCAPFAKFANIIDMNIALFTYTKACVKISSLTVHDGFILSRLRVHTKPEHLYGCISCGAFNVKSWAHPVCTFPEGAGRGLGHAAKVASTKMQNPLLTV